MVLPDSLVLAGAVNVLSPVPSVAGLLRVVTSARLFGSPVSNVTVRSDGAVLKSTSMLVRV